MKIQTYICRIWLLNTVKHLSSLEFTSCDRHDTINSYDLKDPTFIASKNMSGRRSLIVSNSPKFYGTIIDCPAIQWMRAIASYEFFILTKMSLSF